MRKIQADATTQIENILYETDSRFSGKRVEIRYEPEWLGDATKMLPIYEDGKKIGEAQMVRFHDNAHTLRHKSRKKNNSQPEAAEQVVNDNEPIIKNSISYSDMMGGQD
jgi:hypothetical protein